MGCTTPSIKNKPDTEKTATGLFLVNQLISRLQSRVSRTTALCLPSLLRKHRLPLRTKVLRGKYER